ncbi:hypothetical protein KWY42_018110 [Clostridioides difficile]|nr:hypothetical protein [Clostridioides difficile]TQX71746.1 hypothetical protein D1N44_06405 [Clostridioides difficile]HBG4158103.1 hypothetical protein [Clostridioides difficile]HCQ5442009.1 hypothetical protein [Clostridioides difficile]HDF5729884.1 hypothetical protein [Clostridioides difficile]
MSWRNVAMDEMGKNKIITINLEDEIKSLDLDIFIKYIEIFKKKDNDSFLKTLDYMKYSIKKNKAL